MEYEFNNISDYLIAEIALCGEVQRLPGKTWQSKSERELEKHAFVSISRPHRRIRLKSPDGLLKLKELSGVLYRHYMDMTNEHRFPSAKQDVLRCENIGRANAFLLRHDCFIDNIKITNISNELGKKQTADTEALFAALGEMGITDRSIKKYTNDNRNMMLSLEPEKRYFYNSKILKKNIEGDIEGKREINIRQLNGSKCIGTYFTGGKSYLLYYFSQIEGKSQTAAEKLFVNYLYTLHEGAYGKESRNEQIRKLKNGQAVIIVSDANLISSMFKSMLKVEVVSKGRQTEREKRNSNGFVPVEDTEKVRKKKNFLPSRIFDSFHIFVDSRKKSEEEGVNYGFLMLSESEAEEKVKKIVYRNMAETKQGSPVDGYTENGIPSWELLTGRYSKILKIKKSRYRIKGQEEKRRHFICYRWQVPVIKELFEEEEREGNLKLTVYKDSFEEKLYRAVTD